MSICRSVCMQCCCKWVNGGVYKIQTNSVRWPARWERENASQGWLYSLSLQPPQVCCIGDNVAAPPLQLLQHQLHPPTPTHPKPALEAVTGARLSNAGRWTVNYWPVLSKFLSNYNEISCAAFTPTPTKKKTLTSANIWLLSLVWIGTIRAGRYGLEIIWQYSWAMSQYTIYQWWIFKAFEVFTEGPE